MILQSPRRVVRLASRLLILMGLTREQSLRLIVEVCRVGMESWGPIGYDCRKISDIRAEASWQLGPVPPVTPIPMGGDTRNATAHY